jgi:hypothetical protein
MVDASTVMALAAIVLVGMALALSQFCMVRSVLGVRAGDYSPARCVLAISLAIAICLQLLALLHGGETRPSYTPSLAVVLGGLVFGIAARANGGCFIGTLNELCRGHWRRSYTVAGWILGFALLNRPSLPSHRQRPEEVVFVGVALVGLLVLLSLLAWRRRQEFCPNPALSRLRGSRAWVLMLVSGVLVGLLHHSDWPWDPSRLASYLGRALHGAPVPASAACALMLPLGMLIVQRWGGLVQPTRLKPADLQLLLWGTLMGLGAVWGMGANDGYLFRSLPVGSLHAAVGLAAMSAGILLPFDLQAFFRQGLRKNPNATPR